MWTFREWEKELDLSLEVFLVSWLRGSRSRSGRHLDYEPNSPVQYPLEANRTRAPGEVDGSFSAAAASVREKIPIYHRVLMDSSVRGRNHVNLSICMVAEAEAEKFFN